MKYRSWFFMLVSVFVIAGCATKKEMYATGGSRADGVVDLAYDVSQFEKPVVNFDQGKNVARQKCSVWGYSDAEAFGGQVTNCQARNGYGTCIQAQIIVKYQCLKGGEAFGSIAPAPAAAAATPTGNEPFTEQAYKDLQLKQLMQQGLPYDEYQKRYKAIMGQ